VRIIIPSRRRANTIEAGALSLFPDATVCVGESEADAYGRLTKHLLVHPDAVTGMGPLRQWILDHVEDETVFMVDDDVYAIYGLVGVRAKRFTQPDEAAQIVENTAACAKAAGARVFGFNQAWDVRKFLPLKPVSFTGWVGGAIGIIGRDLKFDTSLKLRTDIDVCLTSLLKHRIIYQELRFAFAHRRFAGTGGNAVSRSGAQHERELAYLQRKWGAHLHVRTTKTAVRLIVDVPRTQ
jgi:hypothetical protein